MEIKKKILYATFLGSALLFQQCGTDEPATKKRETEVYVGGQLNINADNWAAAFSKNGVIDTLEDGSLSSGIYDITGSNEDIYMCGFVADKPAYWKNGHLIPVSLGEDYWDSYASNIFVKGQDVYLAGRTSGVNGVQVVYWKNGVPTFCGDGYPSWNGCGLVVSNANDVYMSGYKTVNNVNVAGYWKNGNWNLVSDPLVQSWSVSLTIDGSDIYMAGYYLDQDGQWTACYWKNGDLVTLGAAGSFAYDIKILNGDVYVAGSVKGDNGKDIAVYWKNGDEVRLSNATTATDSYAYSIQLKDNDIYVSGDLYFACDYKSTVWKNGEMVAPFNGNQACYFGDFYTMYVR